MLLAPAFAGIHQLLGKVANRTRQSYYNSPKKYNKLSNASIRDVQGSTAVPAWLRCMIVRTVEMKRMQTIGRNRGY